MTDEDIIIIKKDGRKEKFIKEKIIKGVSRAGAKEHAEYIAEQIAKEIKGKKEIFSSSIREMVVNHLHKIDSALAKEYEKFQKAVRAMLKNEEYIENKLKLLIGENGDIKSVYGGFHIIVTKPEMFDFKGVFQELLNANQSISIEKTNDNKIKIVSK